VAYFGEPAVTDCGHCDICLRRQSSGKSSAEAIEALLRKNAMNATALVEALLDEGYEDVRDTLREMLDKRKLELTPEGFLRLAR
jgi:hypothetical protein